MPAIFSSLRKTINRYRLMVWVIFLGFSGPLWTVDYTVEAIPNVHLADRFNYVSNPDNLITQQDVVAINQLARQLEEQTNIQMAIVAVKSIGEQDARMFATDLFRHWGLGNKQKNNGLLIQLVTEPPQRSIVFEVGYGLEGIFPDAISYRLQQRYMIPDLRDGNYSAAMKNGVTAVTEYLLANDEEKANIVSTTSQENDINIPIWLIFLIFALPFVGLLLITYFKNRPKTCPRCGKRTFKYVGRQIVQQPTYFSEGIAVDVYRCSNCGYTNKQNRRMNRAGRDMMASGGLGGILGGSIGGLGRGGRGGGFGGGGSWGGGSSGGGGSISRF